MGAGRFSNGVQPLQWGSTRLDLSPHPRRKVVLGSRVLASLRSPLAPLVLLSLLAACACAPLIPGEEASLGGTAPPPSGSLSVSFIDVGQGDGVLVQAGGEDYLIDAGRAEEGPNVVDFLRGRGVEALEAIVVSNPSFRRTTGFGFHVLLAGGALETELALIWWLWARSRS
jgi:hypothetical protein